MRTRPTSRFAAALILAAGIALTMGCELAVADFKAETRDEWKRSYAVSEGGALEIANTNGAVEVAEGTGQTIEVTAHRRARAGSDETARDLLRQVEIREDVGPARVRLETRLPRGIRWGGVDVRYTVTVPAGLAVTVENTNGRISLSGLSGAAKVETTNGGIDGKALSGPVTASTTNGGIDVDLTAVHASGVSIETTNGGITLNLPRTAKADVSAECTNGSISTDLPIERAGESSRRRLRGTLNGGGPRISVETVNGGVHIDARAGA